jgi:hypothetical protein
MLPRIYATGTVVLIFLMAASGAGAVTVPGSPHGHAKPKCKRGYHRVKRHHKSVCVKRRKKAAAKPAFALHAHLDTGPRRDPLNPFKVTYGYSASATRLAGGGAARASAEEPLPEGVLALYSDGKLECAVNVGGANADGECPVNYTTLGAHKVTTIYTSGQVSATETTVQQIDPLPTTSSLTAEYEALPEYEAVDGYPWLRIGTLHVRATVTPATGTTKLGFDCLPATLPGCIPLPAGSLGAGPKLDASGLLNLPVYLRENAESTWEVKVDSDISTGTIGPSWLPASDFSRGVHYFRVASTAAEGYLPSEATAAIQFVPEVRTG